MQHMRVGGALGRTLSLVARERIVHTFHSCVQLMCVIGFKPKQIRTGVCSTQQNTQEYVHARRAAIERNVHAHTT